MSGGNLKNRSKKSISRARQNKHVSLLAAYIDKLVNKSASVLYAPRYRLFALAVLFASTLLWSVFGALVNQGNSDHLVNSYLFENSKTFHGSELPGAHSFLIKWPLFFLVSLFGAHDGAFLTITVISSLATVGLVALIIHRFEKRPVVFGTLCLALASVLFLIPAQPAAGALLPVNMAMLTTRNLEYVVYIYSCLLILNARKFNSRAFIGGSLLLATLVASDKLFMTLSLAGAALALIFYSLRKGWNLVSLSVNWLVASVIAALGGLAILSLLNSLRIIHIISSSNASPYTISKNIHDITLGIIYSISGIFTNTGANPAFDALNVKDIPSRFIHGMLSLSGPAYLVNIFITFLGLYCVVMVIQKTIKYNQDEELHLGLSGKLSTLLIWSSAAALLSFIFTKHYYAADSRYLTIVVFALFMSITAVLKKSNIDSRKLVRFGMVVVVVMLLAIPSVIANYHKEKSAMDVYNQRNKLVAEALNIHKTKLLVGDYWRVIPTKEYLTRGSKIMPMGDCSNPRTVLTSRNWDYDLGKTPFAYLLTLEKGQAGSSPCDLNATLKLFGRPNSSVLISGSQDNPKELVLFYDNGANTSAPNINTKTPATILPVQLDEIPYTSCPTGKTIMNVVAHQDDDLLFINPDTMKSLNAGDCIRTVYLTAGDSGSDELYWVGREKGSQAAYTTMENVENIWVDRIVQLKYNEFIQVDHPRADYKVSLIFIRLPDGNLKGSGFKRNLYDSLSKLYSGDVTSIMSVDQQSRYTKDDLVSTLARLMKVYGVNEIRTQSSFVSTKYPDHSDHINAGKFAELARIEYMKTAFENNANIPINYYSGYPIHEMPENVSGTDLTAKYSAFLSYAEYDKSVCHSISECGDGSNTYGIYLHRQYQKPY